MYSAPCTHSPSCPLSPSHFPPICAISLCPLSVPSHLSLLTCPFSALSHSLSLAIPSHFKHLECITFPLILWLFFQPCPSHSSLSSPSLDAIVTIMSLFYPVLLYVSFSYTSHYATWAMVTQTLATTWVCLNHTTTTQVHYSASWATTQ